MPFIPAISCVEVDLNQRLHGEQVQNTLYGVNFGGVTPANIELLAGEMITWVGTQLYPNLADAIQLTEVKVRDLNIADGPQFIGVPTLPVVGQGPGAALPGNVAACVSFRTGLTGRSRRGRNYVAGLPEAGVTGNALSQTLGQGIRAAYEALLAPTGPFAVAGYAWVVLSRYSGVDPVTGRPVPRASGLPTFVNAVLIDANVDSQRRRLAGRGV